MNKNIFKNLSKKLNTPIKVQKFVRQFKYNHETKGETLKSAYETLKCKRAHCLEAALLAAAILEHNGYKPLVMSLESIDNLDHVIFVYQKNKKWGSIGCSRTPGLFGRRPVYRSLKALAMSYYEPYIDETGCIKGYQIAHLDDIKSDWRFSSKNVWIVERYLVDIKHVRFRFNKVRYKLLRHRYFKKIFAKKKKTWI